MEIKNIYLIGYQRSAGDENIIKRILHTVCCDRLPEPRRDVRRNDVTGVFGFHRNSVNNFFFHILFS